MACFSRFLLCGVGLVLGCWPQGGRAADVASWTTWSQVVAGEVAEFAAPEPVSILDWLAAGEHLRTSTDHAQKDRWVALAQTRYRDTLARLTEERSPSLREATALFVWADFLAGASEADQTSTEQAAHWRQVIDAQMWDAVGNRVVGLSAEGEGALLWPVVAGAARREAALELADQWMMDRRLSVAWSSAAGSLGLARGFERYGRRDVSAAVLEAALDRQAERAATERDGVGISQMLAEWRTLTGGERGRVLPPPTPFPGRPPLVPYWAFRPWVWEDNGNTAESTLALVQGYLDRDIPVGAVIVDSPWSTAYNDFNWDRQRYPDPAGMVNALHERGVKVVMWLTGTVNETSKDTPLQADPAGNEVVTRGYAVDGGRVFDWWKGQGRLIDFTNPEAVAWWAQRFDQVAALGIDGWKVDVSDDYTDEVVDTFLGRLPQATWRQYYYAAVHDVALSHNPASAIIARPFSHQGGFAAPVSKATIGWAGDFPGDWDGMRWQVSDLYTSARAGYATLYYEVGGYQRHVPDKEQLIRHAQLGAFFPVMSNGGANGGLTGHLPWYHDEETVAIYRRFAQWHSALAPYHFGLAIESNLTGRPLLREVDPDDWLHQLGDEILVAPVFAAATSREIPATGDVTWLDWWTQVPLAADAPTVVDVSLDHYPVYVRAGAVIPLDLRAGLADWGLSAGEHEFALWIVPGEARRTVVQFPAGEGIERISAGVTVDAVAHEIVIEGEQLPSLELVVATGASPARVEGAVKWNYDASGRRLYIELGSGGGRVVLHGK